MIFHKILRIIIIFLVIYHTAFAQALNNPYSKAEATANILYSSFSERPKTLDPARAYSSNEYIFISQIYEPPLQYHYLKRPFTLEPLTAVALPKPEYLDKNNHILADNAATDQIAYSVYIIHIKPGIYYQPHPAFAKDKQGNYLYLSLNANFLKDHGIFRLKDFKQTGTRELTADDYVYQIKRLAHPEVESPIFGLMNEYIVGLSGYGELLTKEYAKIIAKNGKSAFLDLRKYPLAGVTVTDRYTYQIKIKGKYPQFIYWLAMPFFSPMPWEADQFDSQPGMAERNIDINWYPVGTGPYLLAENNPNRKMVLVKNPNFHGETYPTEGEAGDKEKGLLDYAGKPLPFIDKIIFSLEKESIPRWSKFLQGYYDNSGISSDSYDQAIHIDNQGEPQLSPEMQQRGIKLYSAISPSSFYLGFNMLDDVVGGYAIKQQKLRQAIAIALDYEEYISIFLNGRGISAQGPIPPGIFGYQSGETGINPMVYRWQETKPKRRSIEEAKQLLAEAGFPNGRDAKTGQQLVLNYDVPASSGPDDSAQFDWFRKQFAKLGIELNIRATQYNRFQEKMRSGDAQIFAWGWNADYPDPENFLFLLYGPNGKVKFAGENAANYRNPEYDSLYTQMKNLPNGDERLKVINAMLKIVREDSPWIWGVHPKSLALSHQWNHVIKPNDIANNTLKYQRLNPKLRAEKRKQWNEPIYWPILLIIGLLIIGFIPVIIRYWRQEHRPKIDN